MNEQIPCINCLLIPICRHRKYKDMLIKCTPLLKMLYEPRLIKTQYTIHRRVLINGNNRVDNFDEIIKRVEDTMKPVGWRIQMLFSGKSKSKHLSIRNNK